jgi:hypothetical protein
MTWLVKVALERPYTFIVVALMILIFGPLAAIRTPTDIFPNIGIPVIGVAFTYSGLSPDEMSSRIMGNYERFLTTTVNDVEHVESQSMPGLSIAKIYFQPNVDIRLATAQVTSVSQTAIRQMPVGTLPPLILNYSASTVPVLQLASSSRVLSEQQVLDLTQNFLRPQLTTVRGAAARQLTQLVDGPEAEPVTEALAPAVGLAVDLAAGELAPDFAQRERAHLLSGDDEEPDFSRACRQAGFGGGDRGARRSPGDGGAVVIVGVGLGGDGLGARVLATLHHDDVAALLAANLEDFAADLLISDGVLGCALVANDLHEAVPRAGADRGSTSNRGV